MEEKQSAMEALRAWLEIDGNTCLKLAVELGYEANQPLRWIKIGRMPRYVEKQVLSIIGKGK